MNAESVSELENFPFETFKDFRAAYTRGEVSIGIDRGAAREWATNGSYASTGLIAKNTFFVYLPFVSTIFFILWAIFTANWIMFLALPAFIVEFFLAHPSWAQISRRIRHLRFFFFIFSPFAGLVYSFATHSHRLLAVCSVLIVIWYSGRAIHDTKYLRRAVFEHEDLLCFLWNCKALSISFPNGDKYYADYETVNRQMNIYEKECEQEGEEITVDGESDELYIPDSFWEDVPAQKNEPTDDKSTDRITPELLFLYLIDTERFIDFKTTIKDFDKLNQDIFIEEYLYFKFFALDFAIHQIIPDFQKKNEILNQLFDNLEKVWDKSRFRILGNFNDFMLKYQKKSGEYAKKANEFMKTFCFGKTIGGCIFAALLEKTTLEGKVANINAEVFRAFEQELKFAVLLVAALLEEN